jgi:hypothetical protein
MIWHAHCIHQGFERLTGGNCIMAKRDNRAAPDRATTLPLLEGAGVASRMDEGFVSLSDERDAKAVIQTSGRCTIGDP